MPDEVKAAKSEEAAPAKKKEPAPEKKKGNPLMMIVMIVGGLLAITGLSAAVLFLFVVPQLKHADAKARPARTEAAALGPVFEVKDLVINSADTDELHYFKVGVAMEVTEPKKLEEVTKRDPQIRDALISEFSQHTIHDLNSAAGREAIRGALLKRLNERFGETLLKSVFFTQYVAQ